MRVPFQPFWTSERAQPGTVFHSKLVERGADGFTEQLQSVQLPNGRQHMGGIGALLASGPQQILRLTVFQQTREGELSEFAGDQPGAELIRG